MLTAVERNVFIGHTRDLASYKRWYCLCNKHKITRKWGRLHNALALYTSCKIAGDIKKQAKKQASKTYKFQRRSLKFL